MNFELTEEQKQFREAVRGFAERRLREGALKRAHSPDHPWDVAKLMAQQGLLGITIPEKDGGHEGEARRGPAPALPGGGQRRSRAARSRSSRTASPNPFSTGRLVNVRQRRKSDE